MDYLQQNPLTLALGKAGLAAGTTTTTTIGNQTDYAIEGKAYRKAASSNAATPTADANTGAAFTAIGLNQVGVFLIGLDSGGNIKIAQGETVSYSDAGDFARAPAFPPVPEGFCPIGYELVKVISTGSAWTMGVSNQASQTGITKVFVDLITILDRPQVS